MSDPLISSLHAGSNAGRPAGSLTRIDAPDEGIGRHHFNFLRAMIEGLDAAEMWRSYMAFTGVGYDARLHVGRVLRMRRRLIGQAERRGSIEGPLAALHPKRLLASAPPLPTASTEDASVSMPVPAKGGRPTLESWVDEQIEILTERDPNFDPEFYSPTEWRELYEEEFGLDQGIPILAATALPSGTPDRDDDKPAEDEHRKAARQLIESSGPAPELLHQLSELSKLERLLSNAPSPSDRCSTWLADPLARRLHVVGVVTLEDLASFINVQGYHWNRKIDRVGPVIAARLKDWVQTVQGIELRSTSLTRPTLLRLQRSETLRSLAPAKRFGLVPLDQLAVPPDLDGRRGIYRSLTMNTWGASTDLEAIQHWLNRYAESRRTLDSYARVAERFYLWCVLERRKPLSSLQEDDVIAYKAFLSNPSPDWIQQGKSDRSSSSWRPLKGPLDPVSQKHTFAVIAGMLSAMIEAGYITANAARGVVPKFKLPNSKVDNRRSFTESQWTILMRALQTMPDTPSMRRGRLILELGATTGLRLIEICTARMENLAQVMIGDKLVWMLEVTGKGNRQRKVQVFDDVKRAIDRHHEDVEKLDRQFFPACLQIRTLLKFEPVKVGEEYDPGKRPIIGALTLPPPQLGLDEHGKVTKLPPVMSDRYGALDPHALRQSLKRLLSNAASIAAKDGEHYANVDMAREVEALTRATTHWLRHFCANSMGADDVRPVVIQAVLGHADLKTTSIYTNAEEKLIVSEMAKLRRRS